MTIDGAWANTFLGDLLGTGPGRGIGVLFMISAIFVLITSLVIFVYPRVRNLEEEIPDAIPDDEDEN